MTKDMRESLERAYEAGRKAGMLEVANREQLITALCNPQTSPIMIMADGHTSVKTGRTAKADIKLSATKIARGVKKAAVPRVSGVKQGIMDLISGEAMSSADIITKSGFKATSVRGTLMTLKKNGLAMNDDGLWTAATGHDVDGNSESASDGF